MEKINWSRVVAGGLLAGVVLNALDFVVHGVFFKDDWAAAMQALNRSMEFSWKQNTAFLVFGLLLGILALWLYAQIRPRYGAGPKTAVIAGIAVWIPSGLLGWGSPAVLHIFPQGLMAWAIVISLVEMVVCTIAGAWLYKEAAPAQRSASAAAGK